MFIRQGLKFFLDKLQTGERMDRDTYEGARPRRGRENAMGARGGGLLMGRETVETILAVQPFPLGKGSSQYLRAYFHLVLCPW